MRHSLLELSELSKRFFGPEVVLRHTKKKADDRARDHQKKS
jgi:hypothetical protein